MIILPSFCPHIILQVIFSKIMGGKMMTVLLGKSDKLDAVVIEVDPLQMLQRRVGQESSQVRAHAVSGFRHGADGERGVIENEMHVLFADDSLVGVNGNPPNDRSLAAEKVVSALRYRLHSRNAPQSSSNF